MKLSALPIILIGLAVGVVVLSYAYFHEYSVNKTQAQYDNEQADLLQAEVDQKGAAEQRVKKATAMVKEKEDAWSQIVATRTLPADLGRGGMNLNEDPYRLVIDARKFRNNVQRAVNAQVKRGGVVVVNGPEIPYPSEEATGANRVLNSYFNYPALPFPLVKYDLGTVTVRGTYKQITDNVRAWSKMPHYLAVADGLRLTGTSPTLTGTYNLSVVGYIEVNGLYPDIAEAGGGGGQGGGPGLPGGPGGPMGAGGRGGPGAGFGPPPGAIPGGAGKGGSRGAD